MIRLKATTAQPTVHVGDAARALRRELLLTAHREGAADVPDWSTLHMVGPFEVFDDGGALRFEFLGFVECRTAAEVRARTETLLRPLPRPSKRSAAHSTATDDGDAAR